MPSPAVGPCCQIDVAALHTDKELMDSLLVVAPMSCRCLRHGICGMLGGGTARSPTSKCPSPLPCFVSLVPLPVRDASMWLGRGEFGSHSSVDSASAHVGGRCTHTPPLKSSVEALSTLVCFFAIGVSEFFLLFLVSLQLLVRQVHPARQEQEN